MGATRKMIDQCMLGAQTRKRTCVSHTLEDETGEDIVCDGRCKHAQSHGLDRSGAFRSAQTARYPSGFARLLALMICKTLKHFRVEGSGPGGFWNASRRPPRRLTSWSRPGSLEKPGLVILNETYVKGEGTKLGDTQAACYFHVDDDLFLTSSSPEAKSRNPSPPCDELMTQGAEALESIGFVIKDRQRDADFEKMVGYEIIKSPPTVQVPTAKGILLVESLLWLAAWPTVDVELLRSVVGVWIWAALVRRSLLSV